jgi:hypothetical protein
MRRRIAIPKHFVRNGIESYPVSRKLLECARVLASLLNPASNTRPLCRLFPGEYNRVAVQIENRCDVLARVVIRQLAQQFSILSIQIQMGVTDSLGLQITNGDYDFRITPRDRH